MRYIAATLVGILLLAFLAALAYVIATRTSSTQSYIYSKISNFFFPDSGNLHVILVIGDGMGPMSITLTRLFANVTRLSFESHLIGAVTTYSSNS